MLSKIFTICLLFINTTIFSQCLNMDVMVLSDFSGSMSGKELIIRNAMVAFTARFSKEHNVKLGIITFNDKFRELHPLSDDYNSILNSINYDSVNAKSNTSISPPLEYAGQVLHASSINKHKVIILISDGEGQDVTPTINISKELKEQGIIIATIYIGKKPFKDQSFDINGKMYYINSSVPDKGLALLNEVSTTGYSFIASWQSLVKTLEDISLCL